jgi:hypothetical protein
MNIEFEITYMGLSYRTVRANSWKELEEVVNDIYSQEGKDTPISITPTAR